MKTNRLAVVFLLALTLQQATAFSLPTLEELFEKKEGKSDLFAKWPKLDLHKPWNLLELFAKKEEKKIEKALDETIDVIEDIKEKKESQNEKLKLLFEKFLNKKEDLKEKLDDKATVLKKLPKKCGGTKEIVVKCPDTYVVTGDADLEPEYEPAVLSYPVAAYPPPHSIYEDVDYALDEDNIKYFS